jgi:hypothetical protein
MWWLFGIVAVIIAAWWFMWAWLLYRFCAWRDRRLK